MSKTAITVWVIIIIIIVIAGIWWYAASQQAPASTAMSQTTAPTPTPTATNQPAKNQIIANPSDDSDAALNSDLTSVDAQMNGVASDQAKANSIVQ